MPNLGATEILIILLIILVLFGARKLPELARSVGRSARIFKSEVKEMKNEDAAAAAPGATAATAATAQPAQGEQDFWDRPENKPREIERPDPTQERLRHVDPLEAPRRDLNQPYNNQ
ncbi:Sec-independent protein translocase subunit TatA [Corynebacterium doosanense]|uniref:Sec-independent protein translocase protein TatA n=1 Tax=Corynebacterium doosanense CAU 212 = DSM 45436 TaxID=558173 RepID=A0A097IG48_9CORY|nr:Sec-independent protein translocase subunit TatA [Corynebacterium doosanense]AIT61077.1 preprotein translocase subunit TatA [Corynebacterium doosanense CAU 212 = DSM 45436]